MWSSLLGTIQNVNDAIYQDIKKQIQSKMKQKLKIHIDAFNDFTKLSNNGTSIIKIEGEELKTNQNGNNSKLLDIKAHLNVIHLIEDTFNKDIIKLLDNIKAKQDKLFEKLNDIGDQHGLSNSTISDIKVKEEVNIKDEHVDQPNGINIKQEFIDCDEFSDDQMINEQKKQGDHLIRSRMHNFTCIHCDKGYNFKTDFESHNWDKHKERKPYHCKYDGCDKSFELHWTYWKHVQSIHRKIRHYTCDYCQKEFYLKTDWSKHVRIHTGELSSSSSSVACSHITSK